MRTTLVLVALIIGSFACGDNRGVPVDATGSDPCAACGPHATCTNATCTCVAGYTGDGMLTGTGCTDVDECAAATSPCDPVNGVCTNTEGGFTCTCGTGYGGDGVLCADVNECVTANPCDPVNGTCVNTAGGVSCGCAAGFTGDGVIAGTGCTDVDECASGATNDCDGFACVNTPGAFHCEGRYAIEPFEGVLARLDPGTFALRDLIPLTSSGSVSGITAMARDPITSVNYAIAKVGGITGRAFGTLELSTGIFTVISSVDRISSLAFLPDGTLYAVTGSGAIDRKKVFTIDKTTGVPTLVGALGHGADGEVVCFNPDDQLMYHFTGGGSAIMESFPLTTPLTTTSVSPGLAGVGEVFGCEYRGSNTFLVHDINSRVRLVTTTGTVSTVTDAVPALFQDVRATLVSTLDTPHTVRPLTGTSAGSDTVTIRGLGLTTATGVTFGGVAAASFTVDDATTITAVTPAGAVGAVDVVVTTSLPYPARWAGAFTYQ